MRRVPGLGVAGLLLLAACGAGPPPSRPVASGTVPEPPPDWSTGLPRLLPGIRACLKDDGAGAIGVTKAWPIGLRLVGVRVLRDAGERVDCVAAEDGDRVFLTERVLEASQLPGERDPLFTPGARRPAGDACVQSSEVAEGWLSYDVCRDPRPVGPAASRQPSPKAAPALPGEG